MECSGLTKRFPLPRAWKELLAHPRRREYRTALSGVSIEVKAGEFFGILGPNGAGKTTLFKLLTTAVLPDAGSASIAGHDVVRDASGARRSLAFVPANERSLNWRLSARENLRVHAALYRLYGDAARARIEEVLRVVGLADVDDRMMATFSSGMKQRLSIARALLADPSVLLLDEPTRSLDPVSARQLRRFLRDELCGVQGRTVVLATHSTEEAFGLCDRVAVLNRGRVVVTGAPERLLREYGDESYRVWTTVPDHPALTALRGPRAGSGSPGDVADDHGWHRVDIEVKGDLARAATTLEHLLQSGVPIARYERVSLTLGDLIERVVASSRQDEAP